MSDGPFYGKATPVTGAALGVVAAMMVTVSCLSIDGGWSTT